MQQEKKETLWAYLFLLFLGGFGAHKFYLGNTWVGVLYIFTGALLGIGLVYDIFTLPFQVSQANQLIAEQQFVQTSTPTQNHHCTCGQ